MIREVIVFVAALITGAIIHIGTIFALPYFAKDDIWHRVLQLGPLNQVHVVDDPQEAVALSQDLDPKFVFGLCRTDVSTTPVLLRGTVPSEFWSLDYVDLFGRSHFSVTNQISGTNLNILLATKGQQRLLAEQPDLIDETAIVVTAVQDKGILALRAFVPYERDRSLVAKSLDRLTCSPLWNTNDFN